VSYLILILPDDSRALIPVAWTNVRAESDTPKEDSSSSYPIAHCRDLMRAQVVVDSLLRKMSNEQTAIKTQKENDDGANDLVGFGADSRISCQSDLGTTRSCCQKRCGSTVIATDGQDRERKANTKETGERS